MAYNLTLPLNFFQYSFASIQDSYLTQSSVLLYAVSAVCVFSGVTGELKLQNSLFQKPWHKVQYKECQRNIHQSLDDIFVFHIDINYPVTIKQW